MQAVGSFVLTKYVFFSLRIVWVIQTLRSFYFFLILNKCDLGQIEKKESKV